MSITIANSLFRLFAVLLFCVMLTGVARGDLTLPRHPPVAVIPAAPPNMKHPNIEIGNRRARRRARHGL